MKDEYYLEAFSQPFESGKSITLRNGTSNVVIAAYGSMIFEALKAAKMLEADNIDVTVINARFAKPIDDKIISLINADSILVTVEDHYTACGFGAAVMEAAVKAGANTEKVKILGVEDIYVTVDSREKQLESTKIDAKSIEKTIKELYKITRFLQI